VHPSPQAHRASLVAGGAPVAEPRSVTLPMKSDPAMPGTVPPAVETRELSRSFNGRPAVDRLNLLVPRG